MTRNDYKQAISLRRDGKSYKQIHEELGVPKSTLSDWLSPLGWSNNIKEALKKEAQQEHVIRIRQLNKIRGERLERAYSQARKEAQEEFKVLKHHPLFIAAMMVYWGEGDKGVKSLIRVTNTDIKMLKMFRIFLTDICQIDASKLHAHLLYYKDMDEKKSQKYWSGQIGIPLENFYKSTILPSRHPVRKTPLGVCSVGYCSTYLKAKILEWMTLFSDELISEDYYKHERV